MIVKPQRQRRKIASNLALPTAGTTRTFSGSAMEIASPVTHSALHFFEKPNVLINYEGSYDQEVFPHVGCRGPQLDFFVTAEAKNLIDLNRILLSVKVGVYTEDGKTRAKVNEYPTVFSNNTLHTLFSHAELYLNGKLIPHSNNCYFHAVFIKTELATPTESKLGQSVKDMITRQKQVSKINSSINCTLILIAKHNARPSSIEHSILTFLTARNFWCRRHISFSTFPFSQ